MKLLDSKTMSEQINRTLHTEDLCRMFDVTYMTIYTWKNERGLPCIVIKGQNRDTIRYHPEDVARWAEREGLRIVSRPRIRLETAA